MVQNVKIYLPFMRVIKKLKTCHFWKNMTKLWQEKQAKKNVWLAFVFELEDCEANLEELEEQVAKEIKNEELIRKQAQVEAQVAQVSERLRGFTHDLTEDYHMTLAEAKEASQVVEDVAIARERLQDLRRRIKVLGPINLDAIAQYDEVNNRLTFLNGQKEDLGSF